jgi:hypothetical protein
MAATRKSRKSRKSKPHRKPSHSVSAYWVLNQLSGMRFPGQGEAYDFMKRSMQKAGVDVRGALR